MLPVQDSNSAEQASQCQPHISQVGDFPDTQEMLARGINFYVEAFDKPQFLMSHTQALLYSHICQFKSIFVFIEGFHKEKKTDDENLICQNCY